MKPLRVVYLNPTAGLGGAERSLLDLIAGVRLVAPETRQHLVASCDGPLVPRARELGAETTILPMPETLESFGDSVFRFGGGIAGRASALAGTAGLGFSALAYARRLARLLRELEPTVVHSNGMKFHLLAWLARGAGGPKVPTVWHIRDFLSNRPAMMKALRPAARGATAALAITNAVADDARRRLPGLDVRVAYDAIDLDYFAPAPPGEPNDAARLDAEAGFAAPPGEAPPFRVALIGAFGRWKGQDVFLRSIAPTLALARRPIRFYIVGGPIYRTTGSQFSREELESLATELGVRDRVGFVPFQEDVARAYRAMDAVVHASTQPEPLGRTILESMACGKPVVVSKAGGAVELFEDGTTALGVAPGDVEGLARAVAALADDPDLGARLSRAALARMGDRYSRESLGRAALALFREASER